MRKRISEGVGSARKGGGASSFPHSEDASSPSPLRETRFRRRRSVALRGSGHKYVGRANLKKKKMVKRPARAPDVVAEVRQRLGRMISNM